jgi:hypothetical protein
MRRVLIAGDSDWTDAAAVATVVEEVAFESARHVTILHGDSLVGADVMAHLAAHEIPGLQHETIDLSAEKPEVDAVHIFHGNLAGSTHTADLVRHYRAAGTPVTLHP